jgi:hypothetical protein
MTKLSVSRWNIVRFVNNADATNSTTTMASVSDLGVALTAGVQYRITVVLNFENGSISIAAKFGHTGPTMTRICGHLSHTTGAAAAAITALPQLSTVVVGTATTQTTGLMVQYEVLCTPSADGTYYPQFATNTTTNTITIKAGSYIEAQALY